MCGDPFQSEEAEADQCPMISPNTGMLWVKGDLPRRRPDAQDNDPEPPPFNPPSDDSDDSDEDEDGEEEGEE